MKSMPQRGTQSLDRCLALFKALVEAGGRVTLAEAAAALDLPLATAHRMTATLTRESLLVRIGRGRYMAGLGLSRLSRISDANAIFAGAARPLLRKLAAETGRTVHLGVLESAMVTYLVREMPPRATVFTRETMQLEAYCSGIGKMLLAIQDEAARETYLADGNFIALTPKTIVDADRLRDHLHGIALAGFALDDEEMEAGLFCISVPVALPPGNPSLAISLAGAVPALSEQRSILDALRDTAGQLSVSLGTRV